MKSKCFSGKSLIGKRVRGLKDGQEGIVTEVCGGCYKVMCDDKKERKFSCMAIEVIE